MKKVGIKYCGGCNEGYSRVSFVNELKIKYKGILDIENIIEEKTYDFIICVSGCTSNCSDKTNLKSKNEILICKSRFEKEDVHSKIDEILAREYSG